jgi:hypothetical protein
MSNTILAIGDMIQGDITTCGIETAQLSTNQSWNNPVVTKQFITYDKCSKEVLSNYSTQELNGEVFMAPILLALLVVMIKTTLFDRY